MENMSQPDNKLEFLFKEKEPFLAAAKRMWLSQEVPGVRKFVEANYDLKIRKLWVLAWGYNNLILLAETDRGKITIRFSQRERTDQDIQFETEVALKLHEAGVPVRVPLISVKGEYFYRVSGGYAMQVQNYLEGTSKPEKFLKSHLASAATLLAAFHSVGRDEKFLYPDRRLDVEELVRESQSRLAGGDSKPPEVLKKVGWVNFRKSVNKFFTLFPREWPKAAEKSYIGLIHGDFNPGNIIFDHQKAVGVLDFERAGWGPQIFDIGFAVAQWSFHNNRWTPRTILETFIESYPGISIGVDGKAVCLMALLAIVERLAAAVHAYDDYKNKTHWCNEVCYFIGKFEKFWEEFGKIQ